MMMHTLTLHTHAALMGDAGVSTHTSKRRQEQQKITLSNCFHKRDSGSKQTVQQAGVLDSSQAILGSACCSKFPLKSHTSGANLGPAGIPLSITMKRLSERLDHLVRGSKRCDQ